jgi:hypothetical protein
VDLGALLDGATRLRMAQDVLAVIESQIEAVLADEELGTAKRGGWCKEEGWRGEVGGLWCGASCGFEPVAHPPFVCLLAAV